MITAGLEHPEPDFTLTGPSAWLTPRAPEAYQRDDGVVLYHAPPVSSPAKDKILASQDEASTKTPIWFCMLGIWKAIRGML